MSSGRYRRARRHEVRAPKTGGYLADDDDGDVELAPAVPQQGALTCRRCRQPLFQPAGRPKTVKGLLCLACLTPAERPEETAAREGRWVDGSAALEGALRATWAGPRPPVAVDVDAGQRLVEHLIGHRPRLPEPHRVAPGRPARRPTQLERPSLGVGWRAPIAATDS